MTATPSGPEWLAYLAAELGTDKRVRAARLSPYLRSKGYTVAVSPGRWLALEASWNALRAREKAFNVAVALFPREADRMASDPDAWRVKIQTVRAALTAEGFL